MTHTNNMNMVINSIDDLFKNNCNNFNEVRDHFLVSNIHHLRTPSLFSSKCNEDYVTKVQRESDKMDENDLVAPSDSP